MGFSWLVQFSTKSETITNQFSLQAISPVPGMTYLLPSASVNSPSPAHISESARSPLLSCNTHSLTGQGSRGRSKAATEIPTTALGNTSLSYAAKLTANPSPSSYQAVHPQSGKIIEPWI